MNTRILKFKFAVFTLVLFVSIFSHAVYLDYNYSKASEQISTIFEDNLDTLSDYSKSHWALRKWRQTGDPVYIKWVSLDIQRITDKLDKLATVIEGGEKSIKEYAERVSLIYLNSESSRSRRRDKAVGNNKIYYILGPLISALTRYSEYQLYHPKIEIFKEFIHKHPLELFALNPLMVMEWAAPLANHVYGLKLMGFKDISQPFNQLFQQIYSENKDPLLSQQQYRNKIYGMTHIIIADSAYYQKSVDPQQHQWILEYFKANTDQIIARTKPDIIIEVGLCFLLANIEDGSYVEKIKLFTAQSISHEYGYILSESGSPDLNNAEHRNILAVLLFNW